MGGGWAGGGDQAWPQHADGLQARVAGFARAHFPDRCERQPGATAQQLHLRPAQALQSLAHDCGGGDFVLHAHSIPLSVYQGKPASVATAPRLCA